MNTAKLKAKPKDPSSTARATSAPQSSPRAATTPQPSPRANTPIINVPTSDIDRCASLITRAFADDPPSRWLWPDDAVFNIAFPRFVRAFAGQSFQSGGAVCTPDMTAAALWHPPGLAPDDHAVVTLMEQTVEPRMQPEVFAVFEQMEKFHPHEPHWHLPLIGVDPSCQGQGLGSALMRFALESCDRHNLPAYLEATSARNAALYARHGFKPVGAIQVTESIRIVPMLRRPNGQ